MAHTGRGVRQLELWGLMPFLARHLPEAGRTHPCMGGRVSYFPMLRCCTATMPSFFGRAALQGEMASARVLVSGTARAELKTAWDGAWVFDW